MRLCDYTPLALRTESKVESTDPIFARKHRLTHAALGLASEFSEMVDESGEAVDHKEELGDYAWYLNLACDAMGLDLDSLPVYEDASFDSEIALGVHAGNLCNTAKRMYFYGRDLSEDAEEEVIKLLRRTKTDWLQRIEDLDIDLEDLLESNIKKLEKRYPDLRFDQERAYNRDLKAEKEALDGDDAQVRDTKDGLG